MNKGKLSTCWGNSSRRVAGNVAPTVEVSVEQDATHQASGKGDNCCVFIQSNDQVSPRHGNRLNHGLSGWLNSRIIGVVLGALVPMMETPAALAGPPLYANSFPVGTSQSECLAKTRKVLQQAGILQGDIQETSYRGDDGRNVHNGWLADHPTENISVVFECDARNGMGTLAAAGANNDAVYAFFNQLWDLFMK